MNKRTFLVSCASFIGIVSIFMPWFSFGDYSINAISEQYQEGYVIGSLFLIILIITLYNFQNKNTSNKINITTIVIAALIVIISFADIILNQSLLDMGASVGIGTYTSIFSSGFIAIYTVYYLKTTSENMEFDLDKEKVVNMAKTSVDALKDATSVAARITKTVVSDVKKELQNSKDQKDDSSSEQ